MWDLESDSTAVSLEIYASRALVAILAASFHNSIKIVRTWSSFTIAPAHPVLLRTSCVR